MRVIASVQNLFFEWYIAHARIRCMVADAFLCVGYTSVAGATVSLPFSAFVNSNIDS